MYFSVSASLACSAAASHIMNKSFSFPAPLFSVSCLQKLFMVLFFELLLKQCIPVQQTLPSYLPNQHLTLANISGFLHKGMLIPTMFRYMQLPEFGAQRLSQHSWLDDLYCRLDSLCLLADGTPLVGVPGQRVS